MERHLDVESWPGVTAAPEEHFQLQALNWASLSGRPQGNSLWPPNVLEVEEARRQKINAEQDFERFLQHGRAITDEVRAKRKLQGILTFAENITKSSHHSSASNLMDEFDNWYCAHNVDCPKFQRCCCPVNRAIKVDEIDTDEELAMPLFSICDRSLRRRQDPPPQASRQ